jgi:AraC-like DNA-binding protein
LTIAWHDSVDTAVVFGSVRVSARSDAHPVAPHPDARPGEAWISISLERPPTAQGGVHERRGCSAILVTDAADPVPVPPTRSHLCVVLPEQVLHGIGLEDVDVFSLNTRSALFWPFLTFAWVCATAGDRQSGLTLYYVERLLQEMVTGIVVASLQSTSIHAPSQSYAAALTVITARVGDPSLTPRSVAQELNTSLRTLQRQFSAKGATVDRSIRRARVDHATALLQDPVYDSLTIDRVAQACGLSNGSSLARAFAAEGQPSPSAVRSAERG